MIKAPAIFGDFLTRLMSRTSPPRAMRLTKEDMLAIEVADRLRMLCMHHGAKIIWLHPANEGKRHPLTAILLKAMGLIPGTPDLVFMWHGGCGLIELKAGKNKQTDCQKDFQSWAEHCRVPYVVCRSPDEVTETLNGWGAL